MNKLLLLVIFHYIFLEKINAQLEEISQKLSTSCLSENIISLPTSKEYFIENKTIVICANTTLQSTDTVEKITIHLKNALFQVKNNAYFKIENANITLDDAIVNINHLFFLTERSSLVMNVKF